jgi:immunoglobulin-binding protein 1
MDAQPKSLRELFSDAEASRVSLESSTASPISSEFQDNIASIIASYEECLLIAQRVSLFSPNESLEDINSNDLQYMLINYYLAELIQRRTAGNRKANVLKARRCYDGFLKLLDLYDLMGKEDAKMYERYTDGPDSFSTASTRDPATRRDIKIKRFKEEKELKRKLEVRTRHHFTAPR